MIRLTTIGTVSVTIGEKPVSATNELLIAAILYLVAERGKEIPRRDFAEMFFPDSAANPQHSARQLVYRLRRSGVPVEGDAATLWLTKDAAQWDVYSATERGACTVGEASALASGYLTHYRPALSAKFDAWLELHRSETAARLRNALVRQIQSTRSRKDFRALQPFASACLALDPLNEEATLAAAEALVAVGSKAEAIHLLSEYLDDVGPRAAELRIAPKLLRERISNYLGHHEENRAPLVGRSKELGTLTRLIDESTNSHTRVCLVTGSAGIGKTRLIEDACAISALSGHAVVRIRLTPADVDCPFAVLRDMAPQLLDLPGAIGCAPEALAAIRGLCGRGPSVYSRQPANSLDTRAVSLDVRRKVLDLLGAVTEEQPLILWIEDADSIDAASLELIVAILNEARSVTIVIASRLPLPEQAWPKLSAAVSRLALTPLAPGEARAMLDHLFVTAGRSTDSDFADNAVRIAMGVPLFLGLLFRNFQVTGDQSDLPETLAASLTARLDELREPAKVVFDAVVVLGPHCTEARVEAITALPRHVLIHAFRFLEDAGFLRFSEGKVLPAHDLLESAARRRMPKTVSRLLHRASASLLQQQELSGADSLAIALHWEECGEMTEALTVLRSSAEAYLLIGRPREAMRLLRRARAMAKSAELSHAIDLQLFSASCAASDEFESTALADRLGLFDGKGTADQQIAAIEASTGAGRSLAAHERQLRAIAADKSVSPATRGRAAKFLLMIAEDTGDPAIAACAMTEISDLDASTLQVAVARLVYETVFGSTDEAISIALCIMKAVQTESDFGSRILAETNALYALYRGGELEALLEGAPRAYDLARRHEAWSRATGIAGIVAEACWCLGDVGEAKRWLQLSDETIAMSSGPDRRFHADSTRMAILIAERDFSGALQILDAAERDFPRLRSHRMAVGCRAYRLRIQMGLGKALSPAEVERLLNDFQDHWKYGGDDIVADTLVGALLQLGRAVEAEYVRRSYLETHRKDRFPIAPGFAYLVREATMTS